jgi:histidinol-phosphate/aromatic aminotransferase/cobyric acid decarboxylase-like protein/choline kinase
VLAAGCGRRLERISAGTHKALTSVGGMTILDRILMGFKQVGITRVTVVTGYQAREIETAVRASMGATDLQFVHNADYSETNNTLSLSQAFDGLTFDADVVLVECDVLFDGSLLERLANHPAANAALVDAFRVGMDGTVVDVDNDGYISAVHVRATQDADFTYAGRLKTLNIYRFEAEFCRTTLAPRLRQYLADADPTSYYEEVFGTAIAVQECRIAALAVDGERWFEVDDPNDLVTAKFFFEPETRVDMLDTAHGGRWNLNLLDFSHIHNAFFPPPAMVAEMRHALPELMASYGSSQWRLNEKVSHFVGSDPGRIQTLNGASQAYPILRSLFGSTSVAHVAPTFGEYPRMFPDAQIYADGPGIAMADLDDVASGAKLCIVVNPNNPTGTTLGTEDLYDCIRRHPRTTFLVDESFIAFSNETSLISHLEADPLENAIVLVSLSKCLGLPGLRLGYLYCADPRVHALVGREIPVWNCNAIAEFALEAVIKFRPEYDASLIRVRECRAAFADGLRELKSVAQVHPSGGNFLLVDLHGPASAATELRRILLSEHGMEVKELTGRFADSAARIRIAVRTEHENNRLIHALHWVEKE